MDEFGSFISLQDDDFFLYHQQTVPPVPLQQQNIEQDLVIPGDSLSPTPLVLETNEQLTVKNKKGKRRQKSLAVREDGCSDDKEKRIVHRDIERQRRQEMSNLYASLRTLLPLEYIKGMRSISDQVNQAAKYIKYKEENIRQLQSKRDKLRNVLDARSDPDAKPGSSGNLSPIEMSIRPCLNGCIEILISNGEEQYQLSRVLEVLVEEGLTVYNCFYTKANVKFIYTIQAEASHVTGFDIRLLPQKLSHKIKAPINFKCYSDT